MMSTQLDNVERKIAEHLSVWIENLFGLMFEGNYANAFKMLQASVEAFGSREFIVKRREIVKLLDDIIEYFNNKRVKGYVRAIVKQLNRFKLYNYIDDYIANTSFMMIISEFLSDPYFLSFSTALLEKLKMLLGLPTKSKNKMFTQLVRAFEVVVSRKLNGGEDNFNSLLYFLGALVTIKPRREPSLLKALDYYFTINDEVVEGKSRVVEEVKEVYPSLPAWKPFILVRQRSLSKESILTIEYYFSQGESLGLLPSRKYGFCPIGLIIGLQGSGKTTLLRAIEYYYYKTKRHVVLDLSFDERRQLLYSIYPQNNKFILDMYRALKIPDREPRIGIEKGKRIRGIELGIIVPENEVDSLSKLIDLEKVSLARLDYELNTIKRTWNTIFIKPRIWCIYTESRELHYKIVERVIRELIKFKQNARLTRRIKTKVMVGIDEIHILAPSKRVKGITPSITALSDLYTHARGFTIPLFASTIRPLEVIPDVRNKVNAYFISHMSAEELDEVARGIGLNKKSRDFEILQNPLLLKYKIFLYINKRDNRSVFIKPIPPPFALEEIEE